MIRTYVLELVDAGDDTPFSSFYHSQSEILVLLNSSVEIYLWVNKIFIFPWLIRHCNINKSLSDLIPFEKAQNCQVTGSEACGRWAMIYPDESHRSGESETYPAFSMIQTNVCKFTRTVSIGLR